MLHNHTDFLFQKTFAGIDAVLWINLDRNFERYQARQHDFRLLQNVGVNVERIQAADGKDDDVMIHFENERLEHKTNMEYATLLSHLRAIQRFHRSNWSTIIIFEDDVSFEFSPYWREPLKAILDAAPPDWQMIQLSYMSFDPTDRVKSLYSAWNGTWSTLAYAVNRSGANAIMNRRNATSRRWSLPPLKESFHEADWLLFVTAKTYVYRLPYFVWNTTHSDIHPDHLDNHNLFRQNLFDIWRKESEA
jgi:GR25 family glycosyltransferase involved in LPS biosynthesis